MFGLSLKEKAEAVINNEFHYVVSDIQRQTFSMLVSQGKSMQQNEYSIAIMYMLMIMNMLVQPFETEDGAIDPMEGKTKKEKKDTEDFIQNHADSIMRIMHLANSPEKDIKDNLQEVLLNAGLNK